jgi:hypothetical protein
MFVFIIVATILFILLVPKKRESFQVQTPLMSSRQLYQISNNYPNDLLSRFTTLSDNDDMLIMAGCYQMQWGNWTARIEDCLSFWTQLYTSSFEEVRVHIINELQKVKARNNNIPLDGPAYIMIGQAPYMVDSSGNVITMQYNTRSYGLNPVNVMREGATLDEFKKPLLVKLLFLFPAYFGNMSKRPRLSNIEAAMSPFLSKKDQCYISCTGDVSNSYCGCINMTQDPSQPQSYTAKCSSTPLPVNGVVDTTKNERADFLVMYSINPRASVLIQSGIFAT